MVSKTIENAQTRVEGYNFDIRKRVVEYDDVINKQRETIYAERDKVLHNEDLTETVRGFLDDEIDALVDEHLAAEVPDDWNIEGLAHRLLGMGFDAAADVRRRPLATSAPTRPSWRRSARQADAAARATRQPSMARRRGRWSSASSCSGPSIQLWVEHLTEIDDMRRGVGLRGLWRHRPAERVQA